MAQGIVGAHAVRNDVPRRAVDWIPKLTIEHTRRMDAGLRVERICGGCATYEQKLSIR